MKRNFLIAALLGLMILAVSTSAPAESGNWHTDWKSAAAESKKTGKPILMDFTGGKWCLGCVKLKKEVFSTSEFNAWAPKNVVLLVVDLSNAYKKNPDAKSKANKEFADKYKVEGLPTVVFADSNGKEIGRCDYKEGGPTAWIKKADAILK